MKKKSFIAKGLIASSMLYANVNATNPSMEDVFIKDNVESVSKYNKNVIKKGVSQIYQWRIETETGIFAGICQSMGEVNKEIVNCSNNVKIITKNITPTYLNENEMGDKLYTWSVVTKMGHASGQSATLEEAKNTVKLFETKDVVESNIIELKTKIK